MGRIKPLLIVAAVLIGLAIVCSFSTSKLLDQSSHTIDSATLYQNSIAFQKAFDAVNSSYKTIDNQTNVISQQSFTIGLLALGFLGVGILALVFSAQISKAFATLGGSMQQLAPGGGTSLIHRVRPAGDAVVLNPYAFHRYQHALTDAQAEELYYQLEDLQSILAQRLDWDFVGERESGMVVRDADSAALIDWNKR